MSEYLEEIEHASTYDYQDYENDVEGEIDALSIAFCNANHQKKLLTEAIKSINTLIDFNYKPFDYSEVLQSLQIQLTSIIEFLSLAKNDERLAAETTN